MSLLSILFEDSHLLVINKSATLHSVSQEQSDDSIARRLIELFPSQAFVAEREGDGGLINRLDFETSGILIAARSRETWNALRSQYPHHEIQKTYLALVEGAPQTPLVVEGYLGNRHRGSKKVTFQREERERFLLTRSEICEIILYDKTSDESLVSVQTTTGARHQVRAHCAAVGHPLVGDALYGSQKVITTEGAPSFLLHAHRVTLHHPVSKKAITFEAPPPPYLPKP